MKIQASKVWGKPYLELRPKLGDSHGVAASRQIAERDLGNAGIQPEKGFESSCGLWATGALSFTEKLEGRIFEIVFARLRTGVAVYAPQTSDNTAKTVSKAFADFESVHGDVWAPGEFLLPLCSVGGVPCAFFFHYRDLVSFIAFLCHVFGEPIAESGQETPEAA